MGLLGAAFLDNGTWRDSVFYNLLGEDFPRMAVSLIFATPS